MRSKAKLLILGLVACLFTTSSAQALRIAIPNLSTPQKSLKAELIVVGKVVELEKDLVEATQHPQGPKGSYQIAVVKVGELLSGAKGLTQVRVGFIPQAQINNPAVDGPAVLPIRRPPFGGQAIALTANQEGCFFLKKHHDGDFYTLVQFATPLDKKAENFKTEIESVKKIVKVLEKPVDALKSDNADERKFAAAVLMNKYGQQPDHDPTKKQVKQAPIDAAESKLIMKALGEMEWSNMTDNFTSLSSIFHLLQLSPKDGWVQPKFNGQGDFNALMKDAFVKWNKENGEKFAVKRWVLADK